LCPRSLGAPYLSGAADLAKAVALAVDFDISKEAAARRYVALHDETLAVLFVRGATVRYVDRPPDFPVLSFWNGDRLPHTSGLGIEWDELDTRDWLKTTRPVELSAQMLRQADDYAILLLRAENTADDEADETGVDEAPTFPRR